MSEFVSGLCMSLPADMNARACNCIGPRNGQPRCPCGMAGIVERGGRWIQLERDLGPVRHGSSGRTLADATPNKETP